jgi:hypothetical protein
VTFRTVFAFSSTIEGVLAIITSDEDNFTCSRVGSGSATGCIRTIDALLSNGVIMAILVTFIGPHMGWARSFFNEIATLSCGTNGTDGLFACRPVTEGARPHFGLVFVRAVVTRRTRSAELLGRDGVPLSGALNFVIGSIRAFIAGRTHFALSLGISILVVASHIPAADTTFFRHFWLRTGVRFSTFVAFKVSFT